MISGLFASKPKVNIEIERKYLLNSKPDMAPLRRHKIRQGYIAREAGNVVRIRQKDDQFILSIKTPTNGAGRFEIEKEIDEDEAKVLFSACGQKPIEKTREIYPIGGHIWEVDIFTGENDGLIVAEVELMSEKDQVTLPDWVGPEVSDLQKFYNANLSLNPFKNWGVTYDDLVDRLMK